MSDGLTAIERIRDAATHAMRLRSAKAPVRVELLVLPVGIEVCVGSYGRQIKRLLGWQTIEQARFNVLSETIDEMVKNRDNANAQ